jgi:hypothetical protein
MTPSLSLAPADKFETFSPFADAALSDLQARAAELVLPSRLSA